ncbi:fimbrial protein [Enterobacter asburiae]|uniref:fimbrial protein n=1 Tax=Enterobacter asburiae TaxID=61645 RepID=UPI00210B9225|nr:fimbrial protein [Enterobacter asburiae]MCQ4369185.1 fimbrial protein [Enterobacter asburiae]HDC4619760.1 fimbrial protein [Enterobacter asburiae]
MKLNNALQRVIFGLTAIGMPVLNSHLYAANITSTQFTITGILEAKTCSFNETALTVDLPEVETRTLNNSNSIQGKTEFTLSLNCTGGVTSVSITPSGTAISSGDNTLFLNTMSAQNVGLRLLDKNGNILTPNGQKKVSFDYFGSGGKYTFSAGYAATGVGRVSSGSFQAIVNFRLDYS